MIRRFLLWLFPPMPELPKFKVSGVDVATHGELKPGEHFRFVVFTEQLQENDIIGVKRSPYTFEVYGVAKIVEVLGHGEYIAKVLKE